MDLVSTPISRSLKLLVTTVQRETPAFITMVYVCVKILFNVERVIISAVVDEFTPSIKCNLRLNFDVFEGIGWYSKTKISAGNP